MDSHKPGQLSRPAGAPKPAPAAPAKPAAPVTGQAPVAPVAPQKPSSVVKSVQTAQALRPAPLAPAVSRPMGGGTTVMSQLLVQMRGATTAPPPPVNGEVKSYMSLRIRNEELKNSALGAKGVAPERIKDVEAFLEMTQKAGRFIEDERQRAYLAQALGFWSKRIFEQTQVMPQVQLAEFANGE
ncbi:MAG: hypothetical protein AB2A00_40440 [Myxococcota bacterium]